MRNAMRLFPLVLGASLVLAACGSSSSNSTSSTSSQPAGGATSSSTATVKTASSSLGTILVDAQGMTLYHLSGEQNGKFICSNTACTGIWHPLTVSTGVTPSGVQSLAVVKRPDGTTQVTYKGEPLYTFVQDAAPGETKGQGVKDVGTWTVTTTSTTATTGGSTSTKTSTSSSGGGSGGYAY
jgi:predicted lipoprotein with Yx(FWY)xxD motif